MKRSISRLIHRLLQRNNSQRILVQNEVQLLALGDLLCRSNLQCREPNKLSDVEFRIFSQFGDDGIIHWLSEHLDVPNKTFIEFGVEDYEESNTRFLLMHSNWTGLVLDGSVDNIEKIRASHISWRHHLDSEAAFVTAENIDDIIGKYPLTSEPGLLHIDIDGNDYWVWNAIHSIAPVIVIVEYNAAFGDDRPVSIPYRADFVQSKAHSSYLYFGCSLSALRFLAEKKGYSFVGCNSAGNNAYFVKNTYMTPELERISNSAIYIDSKFRQSRDPRGRLSYLSGKERLAALAGLPLVDVATEKLLTI